MPATVDQTYEPRVWRCDECNTILGVVMRDTNRVRRLWVFTSHIQRRELPSVIFLRNPPRGLFSIHGADRIPRPGGVQCQYCGALNDWEQSKESFAKLMEHYREVIHEPV